ncbi:hypothetical protein [Aquitalea pelogenes]|uniref:hypothetical protein n=1 Tax=Aquitalea pelogenes TaxID=1293573 RepID=UPI0035B2C5EA
MNENEVDDFYKKICERKLLVAKQKGVTNVSFVLELIFNELMGEFITACRLRKLSFYREVANLLCSNGYEVNESTVGLYIRRIKKKKNYIDEFKTEDLDDDLCKTLEGNVQNILQENINQSIDSAIDLKLTKYLKKYINQWDREVQPLCKMYGINYINLICDALSRSGFDVSDRAKVITYISRARG